MPHLRLVVVALVTLSCAVAGAQTDANTALEPNGNPAKPPLLTPRSTYEFVQNTVAEARQTTDPEAKTEILRRARIAFDASQIDPAVWETEWANYILQLTEITERLDKAGYLQPTETDLLPDTPTGSGGGLESFGQNPIILVLERVERKTEAPASEDAESEKPAETVHYDWVYAAQVVKNIPAWYAGLDVLLERIESESQRPAPDPNLVPVSDMAAPYLTLKSFLEFSSAAGKDGGDNWAAARAHLDFYSVAAERLQKADKLDWPDAFTRAENVASFESMLKTDEALRISYVESLAAVLNHLISAGIVDPDAITKEAQETIKPTWAIGDDKWLVILCREGSDPSYWRFSAQTVQNAPLMAVGLVADSTTKPTTPTAAEVVPDTSTATGDTPAPAVQKNEPPDDVPLDFASARATLRTFWDAMREGDLRTAKKCMDLSYFEDDPTIGDQLAGKLWLVMTRRPRPLESQVPDNPTGGPYDYLKDEAGRIRLERLHGGDRKGEWLFTARTVRDIRRLYTAFETKPVNADWDDLRLPASSLPGLYVREYVVPPVLKQTVWGLDIWQWLGVLAVFVIGLVVKIILALILPLIGRWLLRSPEVTMLPHVVNNGFRPTATLAMVLVWLSGLRLLDLGNVASASDSWFWSSVLEWSLSGGVRILQVTAIIVGARAVYMLVDVISGYFNARAAHTVSRADDILIPLMQKTLKFVIVALGGILTVKFMFDLDVWPVFTGLGIGGFAVAFAAQDAIKNFFGSLSLVFDQPFRKGDWVIVSGVEGTIEHVGLRSCRIRTFYKSQVSVPNGEIMNAVVDNMGRRTMRRIKSMISVTYDTKAEALEAFVEGIRELIRQHPYTNKESYHVYVNQFAASSIDVLLYCFVEVPDWGVELRERQRLFIDIIRLSERLGVEFAFPTQTLHMYQEEPNPTRMDHIPHKPFDAEQFGKGESRKIVEEYLPAEMRQKD